ncbi:uncharacterized protein L969DRAFT_85678 [Mixia osmundae IAM 14324]|uniref:Uncharacterized protein n=1 Tax=Mixia osmundae (strain CBS 9802 / IAM 14324 / JCM 22182 / KY 12970) TaxID=764103 RepID=G7E676_MIXOS|nr:uncharacterized protein L969DRAFT_85678 [Mixia osmundae IAM 14324]KEI40510.1 hypothetical protein L969DRAFT_85678 [Mixia osmundae IAM 14324]GAA98336.1 hypothetical protein E5Q_05021 [Mixia osmundae IAM 14324]
MDGIVPVNATDEEIAATSVAPADRHDPAAARAAQQAGAQDGEAEMIVDDDDGEGVDGEAGEEEEAAVPAGEDVIQLPYGTEEVAVDLGVLDDEGVEDIYQLFQEESLGVEWYIRLTHGFWKRGLVSRAFDFATRGLSVLQAAAQAIKPTARQVALEGAEAETAYKAKLKEQIPLLCMLANYRLNQSRRAPRLLLETAQVDVLSSEGQPAYLLDGDGKLKTKAALLSEADTFLTQAASYDAHSLLVRDCQAQYLILTGQIAKLAAHTLSNEALESRRLNTALEAETRHRMANEQRRTKGEPEVRDAPSYDTSQHLLVLRVKALVAYAQASTHMQQAIAAAQLTSISPSTLPPSLDPAVIGTSQASSGIPGSGNAASAHALFKQSLRLYQQILTLAPDSLPDPRIGLGLCLWQLGHSQRAVRAWKRSIAKHPGEASATAKLLLGLTHFNTSKQKQRDASSREAELESETTYQQSFTSIATCFKEDKICSPAAFLLAGFYQESDSNRSIKLAERAIQYSTSAAMLSESYLALARTHHAQANLRTALEFYELASQHATNQVVSLLAMAQIRIKQNELPAALDSLQRVLKIDNNCIEAIANLAVLYTSEYFKLPASTGLAEKQAVAKEAKEIYDKLLGLFAASSAAAQNALDVSASRTVLPSQRRVRLVSEDADVYVDVAKLWIEDDAAKCLKAYRESLRVRVDLALSLPPQLHNNIGCLLFLRNQTDLAQEHFETALTNAITQVADETATLAQDALITFISYNLGLVYEASGNTDLAIDLYQNKLLARHSEFNEAKARLAIIALQKGDVQQCTKLLKECHKTDGSDLAIKALTTYVLVETKQFKAARDNASYTLQSADARNDVYALCSAGMLQFEHARDLRPKDKKSFQERAGRFTKAAESFEKVLQIDPKNAFAAQGLAICLAEGTLNVSAPGPDGIVLSESARRARNLRDAIAILIRLRETVNEASVYVNLGHCYFAREEFEKAIEAFEAASKRFSNERSVSTLLYLARACFHKGHRDRSFAAVSEALVAVQKAHALNPKDLSIQFNMAIVQHRGLEILAETPSEARTLSEIDGAIVEAQKAQEIFARLGRQKGEEVPFSVDAAQQRVRYGLGLIKRAEEHDRTRQVEYESTEQAKLERAKRDRDAERKRKDDMVAERAERARLQAEQLAEQRRQMLEDAKQWYVPRPEGEIEEAASKVKRKARKSKKKHTESEPSSREESGQVSKEASSSSDSDAGAPIFKKMVKKKLRKANGTPAISAAASEQEGEDGADEEGAVRPSKKPRKTFKSSEFVDSDDE